MPKLSQPLTDILSRLSDMDVVNKDGSAVKLYARVWNNQIRLEEDGQLYNYRKPAAFVEIASPVTFQVIGQQYRSADLAIRIHLSTDHYNSEGTFEQDLEIFSLRDKVIGWITGQRLTGCGPLEVISEDQDYQHANVYHYIIEAICNFTDSTGSRLDADKWDHFIEKTPPTDLEAVLSIDLTAERQSVPGPYIIRK